MAKRVPSKKTVPETGTTKAALLKIYRDAEDREDTALMDRTREDLAAIGVVLPTPAQEWLTIYREAEFHKDAATIELALGELHKLGVFISARSRQDREPAPVSAPSPAMTTAVKATNDADLRPTRFYVTATRKADKPLTSDALLKAFQRNHIHSEKIGGRRDYRISEVCRYWKEHRTAIEEALEAENAKHGQTSPNKASGRH